MPLCLRKFAVPKRIHIVPDDGQHDVACEALYARAFGPGRHAKAAARLREGNICRRDFSVLASDGSTLAGACRVWPVVAENGAKALFLGPIAVDTKSRRTGLGQQMVEACLAAIDAHLKLTIILVGDLSYFGRMGFEIVPSGHLKMPRPVDPKRLLWRVGIGINDMPAGKLSVPRATSQIS